MMASVSGVMRRAASLRSMVPVSTSTSQATGSQPAASMAWKEATKVRDGTRICGLRAASRGAMASTARVRAAVPVLVVTTCSGATPR